MVHLVVIFCLLVFNNRVLLQYGKTTNSKNGTITFSTSYTTTNYSVSFQSNAGDITNTRTQIQFSNITKTSFTWQRYDSSSNWWMSIGY